MAGLILWYAERRMIELPLKLDKSKLVRNLAAKQKLVPHIEREIAKGDFPWDFKYEQKVGDDGWHPSGDCTPSMHDLYMKATGQLDLFGPISGSLYKTFAVGHFWHGYLQWIVEKRLEFCGPEDIERRGKKAWADKPYHYATGSGDIAPCEIPGHGPYIVDFKTMNTHAFKAMALPEFFADKYECQMNIYMDFFDLDQALIVGILKDSPHDMKEFSFLKNQPLIDAIYLKWRLVSECLTQGVMPPEDEEIHLPLRGPD